MQFAHVHIIITPSLVRDCYSATHACTLINQEADWPHFIELLTSCMTFPPFHIFSLSVVAMATRIFCSKYMYALLGRTLV